MNQQTNLIYLNEDIKNKQYKELIDKIKSIDDLKYLFNDNNECKNHLVKCISNVNKYKFLYDYIDLYLSFNSDKVDEKDVHDCTLIMIASLIYDEKLIKIILKYSPNLELLNCSNQTVLFEVCCIENTNILNNILCLLLNKKVNLNAKNNYNETPFFKLCKNKYANIDSFKMFLDKNIDITHKDLYNSDALHIFLSYNNDNSKIIDLFYEYGFKFNDYKDIFNFNYIDYALLYDKYDCLIRILLYYDNLNILCYVKDIKFDYKPVKLIKILYHYYYDIEMIKLAISKGAKKEDLINDMLLDFI